MDLVAVGLAAVLVESIVNFVQTIKSRQSDWRYWASLIVGVLAGVVVAVNWDLDLFSSVLGEGQLPLVGGVLTGLILARGSNYVSDVVKLLNSHRV